MNELRKQERSSHQYSSLRHAAYEENSEIAQSYSATHTRVKFAKAAVLNISEFDNYLFWHLVYADPLVREDIQNIEKSACAAGLTEHSEIDPDTFFPDTEMLLVQIMHHCKSPKLIIQIIKRSALKGMNVEWMDRFLFSATNEINFIPPAVSRNQSIPMIKPYPVFLGKFEALQSVSPSNPPNNPPTSTFCLRILAGLLVVGGAIAILTAFIVLQAAALNTAGLVVSGLGVVSVLAGIGLFRRTTTPNVPGQPPSCLDRLNPLPYFGM